MKDENEWDKIDLVTNVKADRETGPSVVVPGTQLSKVIPISSLFRGFLYLTYFSLLIISKTIQSGTKMLWALSILLFSLTRCRGDYMQCLYDICVMWNLYMVSFPSFHCDYIICGATKTVRRVYQNKHLQICTWPLAYSSINSGNPLLLHTSGMSLVQEERLAFMLCEADGEEGLTWPEVEDCEVKNMYFPIFVQPSLRKAVSDMWLVLYVLVW